MDSKLQQRQYATYYLENRELLIYRTEHLYKSQLLKFYGSPLLSKRKNFWDRINAKSRKIGDTEFVSLMFIKKCLCKPSEDELLDDEDARPSMKDVTVLTITFIEKKEDEDFSDGEQLADKEFGLAVIKFNIKDSFQNTIGYEKVDLLLSDFSLLIEKVRSIFDNHFEVNFEPLKLNSENMKRLLVREIKNNSDEIVTLNFSDNFVETSIKFDNSELELDLDGLLEDIERKVSLITGDLVYIESDNLTFGIKRNYTHCKLSNRQFKDVEEGPIEFVEGFFTMLSSMS